MLRNKGNIFLIIVKLAISNWKRKKHLKKSELKMLRLFIPLFLVLILRSFASQKNSVSNVRLTFLLVWSLKELFLSDIKSKIKRIYTLTLTNKIRY